LQAKDVVAVAGLVTVDIVVIGAVTADEAGAADEDEVDLYNQAALTPGFETGLYARSFR
jgi:hypothetical protein